MLTSLDSNLILLPGYLHLELLALNVDLIGSISLVFNLLVQSGCHVLQFVLKHSNSFFRLG
jgi:hypothetical protein